MFLVFDYSKITSRMHFAILEGLTRCLTNQNIATKLGIREGRVKDHVNVIFSKLGAANRTEAVAIALRKHLLKI